MESGAPNKQIKPPARGSLTNKASAGAERSRGSASQKKAQKKNLHAEVPFVFDCQTIICQHLQTELLLVLRHQRVPGQQLQGLPCHLLRNGCKRELLRFELRLLLRKL